jgi:hypothetical protein
MTEQPESTVPPSPKDWPAPESAARSGGRGALTRDQLRETLPVRPVAPPGEVGRRQEEFPATAELEYERSVIRIPFYLKGAARERNRHELDVMAFDAYMRLIREAPTRNGLGLRQFEFFIDAWELNNTFSKGLEANVTFTLSDAVQPKSLCVALQRDADYPAMIVYNAIYDVYVGEERIIQNQPGVAMATPVWEIPPRNVTVAFEKPFESDLFDFSAGTCEGMRSITRDEFERGLAEARATRGQP